MTQTATLLLTQDAWDLCVDADGNIAVATAPYSTAQDMASAIRTVQGEVYYDTSLGVAYDQILGQPPNPSFIKTQLTTQALLVPAVATARAFLSQLTGRNLSAQVQATLADGSVVGTGTAGGPFILNISDLDGQNVLG